MLWKFESGSPVYQQIMDQVRRAVLAGEYRPGDRIPAVRELALAASVNPNTMQRALMTLEQEGLLVTCGTAGRFVTQDSQVLEKIRKDAVDQAIRASARQFLALGLSLQEAGRLLQTLEEEE